MILVIGSLIFDVDLSYQTLQRATHWRHEEVPIVGTTPLLQYSGKESSVISFQGVWFNYRAKGDRVESIEALADAGEPLSVTHDSGEYLGLWVITGLVRDSEIFRPGQVSGIRTAFTISMKYYGETPDPLASIGAPAIGSGTVSLPTTQSDMVRMAATAARTAAGALGVGADKIIESEADSDLSDLKTIPEYNSLVSNSRRDKAKLDRVTDDSRGDVVSEVSKLGDFLSYIDGSGDYVSNIDGTLRKAESLPLISTDKFSTLRTSLNGVKGATRNAQGQRSAVENTLKILSPVANRLGL